MIRRTGSGLVALAMILAGCGSADEEAAPAPAPTSLAMASVQPQAEPDLTKCPEGQLADDELLEREGPLAVPKEFEGLVKSNLTQFAVSTMDGGTVCVDTSWIEGIENQKVSPDGRFLAFDWLGYEAYGYVVVDRSGKGQVIDTGNAPLSPPSGRRFASIELTESGFGSLNAFGVWDILPVGLKQIALVHQDLPMGDWRVGGWQGENCVTLSLLPSDRFPEDWNDLDKAPRDAWFASEKNGWKPRAGNCPKA